MLVAHRDDPPQSPAAHKARKGRLFVYWLLMCCSCLVGADPQGTYQSTHDYALLDDVPEGICTCTCMSSQAEVEI